MGLLATESNSTQLSWACLELSPSLRNSDRTIVWPFYHREALRACCDRTCKDFILMYSELLQQRQRLRSADGHKKNGQKTLCIGSAGGKL